MLERNQDPYASNNTCTLLQKPAGSQQTMDHLNFSSTFTSYIRLVYLAYLFLMASTTSLCLSRDSSASEHHLLYNLVKCLISLYLAIVNGLISDSVSCKTMNAIKR